VERDGDSAAPRCPRRRGGELGGRRWRVRVKLRRCAGNFGAAGNSARAAAGVSRVLEKELGATC